MHAEQRPFGAGFRRGTMQVSRNDQALISTPGITHPEAFERVEKGCQCGPRYVFQFKSEEPARPGKIPPPDHMSRITVERGVEQARHFGSLREPARELQSGSLVSCEAQRHRSQA